MTDRAILYRRVSDDEQLKGYSLDFQQDTSAEYCRQHRYHVVHDFVEPGMSGHDSLDDRPALQELRRMVRRKETDVVVVWRYDRLARDFLDQAVLIREAKHAGVRVESATEPIPDGPMGWVMQAVIGGMSEKEREAIVARTQAGVHKRVESGAYLPGCKAPYGFRFADEKKTRLQADPLTAPVVARIFDLVASGTSSSAVARRLSSDRIPSPSGQSYWTQKAISRIIHHPVYVGVAVAFREQRRKERVVGSNGEIVKRERTSPNSEVVVLPQGTAPALVSKELASLAQQYIQQHRSAPISVRAPENYLLRGGFALCGVCGKHLTVRTKGRTEGTKPIYRCHESGSHSIGILTETLDAFVWERFTQAVKKPSIVEGAIAELTERREGAVGSELRIRKELLVENRRQQGELIKALTMLKNETAMARVSQQVDALAEEETKLELGISELERADSVFTAAERTLRKFQQQRVVDGLTLEERRRMLFDFGVRVLVYPASAGVKRCIVEIDVLDTSMSSESCRSVGVLVSVVLVCTSGKWEARIRIGDKTA